MHVRPHLGVGEGVRSRARCPGGRCRTCSATSCTYGVSGVARSVVGDEVLGLRRRSRRRSCAPVSPVLAELPGGERGDRRGVQAAGEQGAPRHVGDELAARRCRRAARARARPMVVPVVGVLARSPASSTRRSRRPSRSTVTTVPGSTSRMPSQIAWPGVLTKANSSRSPSSVDGRLGPAGWRGSPWARSRTARRRRSGSSRAA